MLGVDYHGLIKTIYKPYWPQMMEIIERDAKQVPVDKGKEIENPEKEFWVIYNDLVNKGLIEHIDFDLEFCDGDVYGEYWPTQLTGEKDKLILYPMRYNDFLYTIIHEMTHAKQYQQLLVDQGNIEELEGYATYKEWHTLPSDYIKAIRQNALYLLKESKPTVGYKESYYYGALYYEVIENERSI